MSKAYIKVNKLPKAETPTSSKKVDLTIDEEYLLMKRSSGRSKRKLATSCTREPRETSKMGLVDGDNTVSLHCVQAEKGY